MADVNKDFILSGDEIGVDSIAPVEPGDVGNELRAARQARKIDIAKCALDLKIREEFLLAIENARYSDLPGVPYAIGYLRSYATYLGLDAEDLVGRFKEETSGLQADPQLIFPAPVKQGRLAGPALIAFSVVLAGIAYGGWYYYSRGGDEGEPKSAAKVTAPAAVATAKKGDAAPAAPGDPKSTTPPPTPNSPAEGSAEAKPPVAATPPTPKPPTARGQAAAAQPKPPEKKKPAKKVVAGPPPPKVMLRATGLTWVRIQDKTGKIVAAKVLRRGATYEVPAKSGLVLHVGRANKLEIRVGDKILQPMRKYALPVSDVSLDPDALLKLQ